MLIVSSSATTSPPDIEWEKTFGGSGKDYGESVKQTTDGGYIIAGSTNSFKNGSYDYDIYVLKTDSNGEIQWNRTFGGDPSDHGDDYGYDVKQTSDGGYVVAGSIFIPWHVKDPYLFKLYPNGTEQWIRQLSDSGSDEDFYSIQQTSDGGYIALVTKRSIAPNYNYITLIKLDSEGLWKWQRGFLPPHVPYGDLFGRSIQQTSDGGYIIAGSTNSFKNGSYDYDIYVLKTDSNGNMLWNKTFGWDEDDEAYSVKQTSDRGYIIAGYTKSFEVGNPDFLLIKTDSTGKIEWNQTFGGESSDYGYAVQQTRDGGYIIAGSTRAPHVYDVYLIKTDSDGNKQWEKIFGGNADDGGYDVQQTSDGGYIIVGKTESFGLADYDIYLIKLSGTLDINLKKGWNLISIPFNLTNNSINYLFNNTNIIVYAYKNNSWFIPIEIDSKLGYWVKTNETKNITLSGTEIKDKTINLTKDWNLVSYPYLNEINTNKSDLKDYTTFAYINSSWSSYTPNRTFNSLTTMKPGYGYWVKK